MEINFDEVGKLIIGVNPEKTAPANNNGKMELERSMDGQGDIKVTACMPTYVVENHPIRREKKLSMSSCNCGIYQDDIQKRIDVSFLLVKKKKEALTLSAHRSTHLP
ncbi:hypothetical protein NPIL_701751 [Nephila pilipes]|uniref:Uncharacterized protein n=1 Tax=Nephila pilipes TaxID=299642 RepID=A0A8X6TBN3_NEPPI|nr:hypothetical protein NPIL_701751 [Nephila pilipes]